MKLLFACAFLLVLASPLLAEVLLPGAFSSHMVLQRGMAVPLWGGAAPGEVVEVSFAGQSKSARADARGFWRLKLEPLKASSEPRTLTVGGQKFNDVLVGDVWVGSGQSNMETDTARYIQDDPVLAAMAVQTHPQVRLLGRGTNSAWVVADESESLKFSALLLSFGVGLQKQTGVPVGLMLGAVGGTPSVHWLTEEMYRSDAGCIEVLKKYNPNYDPEALVAKHTAEMAEWKKQAAAARKARMPPPPELAPLRLPGGSNSGPIGQHFETYIRPYVGYGIKGVLWDQGESGTGIDSMPHAALMGALIRGWRREWGQGDFPWLYVEKPSGGGCAYDDSRPMNRLADKFAPLPEKIPGPPHPYNSHPAFVQIMKCPNTHMVTSSDLCGGLHPQNKSGYGARAAQVALAAVYGGSHECLGPQLDTHTVQGDRIALTFKHAGKGLTFRHGGRLQGFMIAGADQKFVWADAVIESGGIIVSSKDVPQPAAVRYAWSDTFPWANLFNKDGLPAQPFRTDAW